MPLCKAARSLSRILLYVHAALTLPQVSSRAPRSRENRITRNLTYMCVCTKYVNVLNVWIHGWLTPLYAHAYARTPNTTGGVLFHSRTHVFCICKSGNRQSRPARYVGKRVYAVGARLQWQGDAHVSKMWELHMYIHVCIHCKRLCNCWYVYVL